MKITKYVLLILLMATCSYAQVNISANLTAHIDSVISSMPGSSPSGLYLQPGPTSRDTWRQIIQDIITGDYASAHTDALTLDYRVVQFTDNSVDPNHDYIILERVPGASSRYWGTFVFNLDPLRYKLVIESPHSKYDLNTGYQGF